MVVLWLDGGNPNDLCGCGGVAGSEEWHEPVGEHVMAKQIGTEYLTQRWFGSLRCVRSRQLWLRERARRTQFIFWPCRVISYVEDVVATGLEPVHTNPSSYACITDDRVDLSQVGV